MTRGPAAVRYLPILGWLPRYRLAHSKGDLLGAMTAWAIVVPESVAYAQIAGVPPQHAFYAAPVALVAYALFGTSRSLIVGTTSASAILSASTVAVVSSAPADQIELSAALALMVGVVLIVAGLARLGFISNFLAEPALLGFLCGMALIIIVRQLGKIVGISTGDGDFFSRLWRLLSNVDDWSVVTGVVGVVAIAALLLLERFVPRLPASITVLALGIVASYAFDLQQHGVAVVGKIPASVPALHIPDVTAHQVAQMVGGTVGLALIVFAESFSIAERFAQEHGLEVDPNQEMVAMGAANVVAGSFAGLSVSGSASRTAAAEGAGGRTQMVSLVAAVFVLVTAAFLTPLFTQLPEPVLGAIVIVAVLGFLQVPAFRRYWQRDRSSFSIAVAALLGVLVLDLLPGLIIAVVLSLLLFIARASEPELALLGRADTGGFEDVAYNEGVVAVPGALVVRPNGGLFFGNVDRVRKQVCELVKEPEQGPVNRVCLVLSASFRLSLSVLDSLRQLDNQLRALDCQLWLVGVPSQARAELMADELVAAVGPEHIVTTIDDALAELPA